MKQSKLRRRRVVRFAILYFVLLVVFLGIIIAPAVIGEKILPASLKSTLSNIAGYNLLQPVGFNHDNTNGTKQTGTGAPHYTGILLSLESKTSKATGTGKIRLA